MTTIITEQGRWANSVVDERGRRVFANGLNERGRKVFGLVATPAANHLTIQLNDTLTVSDNSITKQRSGRVTLTENLNLNDSASSVDTSGTSHRNASLNDNLTLTDSIITKRSGHVSLNDSMTISDSKSTNLTVGATHPTIQFKRGNETNLPNLLPGEPAVTLDSQKVFVGTASGNIQMTRIIVASGGSGLPIASASYQWVIGIVPGTSGVADGIYICKKQANGTYAWVQFA